MFGMATRARRKPAADAPVDVSLLLRPPPAPDVHQERARRSHQALIDAATELFARHGYDKIGTPELAERAGVSVGTFYRYFADKHVLYVEVVRRMLAQAYEEILAGLVPARFVGKARTVTIEEGVALLFEHVLRRPELSRSLMEMSLRDRDVGELRRAFEQASVARLHELVAAITPRAVIPDPEATAAVLYGACMHCAYGLAGHVGPPPVGPARAKAALVAFIERALFPADR
jgi:AcrR family transcriptional regulator